MGVDIFGTSISGMNAAQIGLATTEHNIANANTPGFNRQEIVIGTRMAQSSAAGFIGSGADVSTVKRVYDQFLSYQVMQQQGQSAQLDTYYAQIQQINNMLADPTVGLSPAMQNFFNAANDVASSPASLPARQTLLSSAQSLASRFQAMNQQLDSLNSGINSQVVTSVSSINSLAKQIAGLNQSIVVAQSATGGQPPNDLLDQRDLLLSELNQEIKVSVNQQSDGSLNVAIGNGQMLVVGAESYSVQTVQSDSDPSRLEIAYGSNSGNLVKMDQRGLQGGRLGGLIAFRNESLDPAKNMLGLIATGLAGTLNQQNQMGQDLNGALGGAIFNVASPVVHENLLNTGGATGANAITATISDYSALTGSDYSLSYSATGYTLTRLSDNTTVFADQATLPSTPVDGLVLTAPVVPNAGDRFLIRPTVNGASGISVAINNPAKIAAALPVRADALLSNTGAVQVDSVKVNGPPPLNASLQNSVSISFTDATHYTVTDTTTATVLASNSVYDPNTGATLSFNGWTMQISGAAATGDTIKAGANTNASADNRNALQLAGLQTRNTLLGGSDSFQGAYGQLVSQVGNKTREIEVASQAQTALMNETINAQQAISGVNLDEEAANLMRYQRAYQASAKAMQIAGTMFDTLLTLGG